MNFFAVREPWVAPTTEPVAPVSPLNDHRIRWLVVSRYGEDKRGSKAKCGGVVSASAEW